nr:hypothetical protein [Tanacetum cinerariifolium]
MCEMACQIIQKKQEEKKIEEEQAANARYWKIPACCDDDDDYNSAITPNEPVNFLSIRDEHLNTIPAMESDEFINSCVENLVPNPSESEGENGCDVPSCFITFSNTLFDVDYEFDSVDYQSLFDEDISEKIFSNPLFEEEIISMKIDQHHFDAESDLIEYMLNHDSSIIHSSSKIDSFLDKFSGELTLLKSISPGIDKTDCYPENEIRLTKRLLYDNSSPRPPEEFVSKNSNADIESFSQSSIPPNSFNYPPDSYHPSHPTYKTYSGDTCGNDSHFGYDCPPQFSLNYEPQPGYIQNYNSYPHDSSSFPQQYPCCEDCERLLYNNSSPRPPKVIVSDNSNADIESFSPSPIPNKDSDSHMEEIDLYFNPDDPMPLGIEYDDYDSERDIPILEELLDNYSLSLPTNESYHFDIPLPYRPPAKPPD